MRIRSVFGEWRRVILLFVSLLLILLCFHAVLTVRSRQHAGVLGDYVGEVTGVFSHEAYAMAVLENDVVIFKNPGAARRQIVKDCPDAFAAIKKDNGILFAPWAGNFSTYMGYAHGLGTAPFHDETLRTPDVENQLYKIWMFEHYWINTVGIS